MMNTTGLKDIRATLRGHGNESDAVKLQHFFKTGPGEYGEGDQFLGVRVPAIRQVAKKNKNLSLSDTQTLLQSAIHEERLLALIILTYKFRNGDPNQQIEIYKTYLNNTGHINNWDLVDVSAEHIVGAYLYHRSCKSLYKLAKSESLWERRIAIMSTFHFIKNDEFEETIRIAERLVTDTEDLIHKAVGWMLREVGKRDRNKEEIFLKKHYQCMPRTMLRYAIEKFPENIRQQYLKGKIKSTPLRVVTP